jgi:hypothetical protein
MTRNDWTIERKTYAQKQGWGKKEKIVQVTKYHVIVPTYEGTEELALETLDEACDIVKQFIERFSEIVKAKRDYDEFCSNYKWTHYAT